GLRSQRSTRADRPGEHIQVTNAQARAPLRQIGATARKPAVDRSRRQAGGQRRQLGPAREQRLLQGAIVGAEYPIRASVNDARAERPEALAGRRRSRWSERRTEPLVGALMQIETGQDLGIE